jgi:hypothetical protein
VKLLPSTIGLLGIPAVAKEALSPPTWYWVQSVVPSGTCAHHNVSEGKNEIARNSDVFSLTPIVETKALTSTMRWPTRHKSALAFGSCHEPPANSVIYSKNITSECTRLFAPWSSIDMRANIVFESVYFWMNLPLSNAVPTRPGRSWH